MHSKDKCYAPKPDTQKAMHDGFPFHFRQKPHMAGEAKKAALHGPKPEKTHR